MRRRCSACCHRTVPMVPNTQAISSGRAATSGRWPHPWNGAANIADSVTELTAPGRPNTARSPARPHRKPKPTYGLRTQSMEFRRRAACTNSATTFPPTTHSTFRVGRC